MKKAFASLVHAVMPRIDYFCLYRARVVTQSLDDGSLDIVPDDDRLPSMSGIRFRPGIPGVTIAVRPGSSVMVGWSEGDPSQPFCSLYEGSEPDVKAITISADRITLGATSGAQPAAKGQTLQDYLEALAAKLTAHVHAGVTTGGGVSGPSTTLATPALDVPDLRATNVRVK